MMTASEGRDRSRSPAARGRRPRWGLLGTGRIAHDFCAALQSTGAEIVACAAKEADRAAAFVEKFGLMSEKENGFRCYGSYHELVSDERVDVVYVSTLHVNHLEHVTLCLQHGKHVLVEKPMGLSERDCQSMFSLAERQGLLCLEAMWTRYFPLVQEIEKRLHRGDLGDIVSVSADIGFVRPHDARGWSRDLGGGALFWNGVYAVQWSALALGGKEGSERPSAVASAVDVTGAEDSQKCEADAGSPDIIDKQGAASLIWKGKGVASLSWSHVSYLTNEVRISGSKGYAKIYAPAHCPTAADFVTFKSRTEKVVKELREPLPANTSNAKELIFPNSEGLQHEARQVEEMIQKLLALPEADRKKAAAKIREAAPFSPAESCVNASICDEVLRSAGVSYSSGK